MRALIDLGIAHEARRPVIQISEPARRPENHHKQIVVIAPSCCKRYLSSWLFADIGIESDTVLFAYAEARV